MKKFTYEQKLEAVRMHEQEHKSYVAIARELETAHSVVERWVQRYKLNGEESLRLNYGKKEYTNELKEEIINKIVNEKMSYTYASSLYQLSYSTIRRWVIEKLYGLKLKNIKNDPMATKLAMMELDRYLAGTHERY